eukprot:CAMPEP_0177782328 /NCGR_PEP_ID=MMETSP0491_2-20121128/18392_1 /TAXON_ID=63592 /ORGANISM="Tetraselmis chuii, Strain PLY429" /LENGTH=668 /DNA_ID=CAMNT_0019302587 /DNA_START=82 /DNA_END=2089 /DNA_ORIENTATION=+
MVAPKAMCSNAALAVIGLLITGAASAVFRKVVYQLSAEGAGGKVHSFEKPWFTTFLSTTTCSFCIILLRLGFGASYGRTTVSAQAPPTSASQCPTPSRTLSSTSYQTASRRDALTAPRHDAPCFLEKGAYGHVTLRKVLQLIAPGVTGHMALVLQGIGLQYTSASINQMVSGSCIVFTAVLSVLILKRRLTRLHAIGVVLSLVGVLIVSVSSLLPVEDPAKESVAKAQPMWLTVFGIVITLISQVVQALQLVLEELLLHDLHLHPFQVLGWEGIIGMLWMGLLAGPLLYYIPGTDAGGRRMEDTLDTFAMLAHSSALTGSVAVYWFTVLGTNMYGVLVTATIGSVFRSVLLTTRTALVWVADLVLFYTGLGGGVVGEELNRWSGIEALGFAFLLVGTLVYAQGTQNVETAVEKAVLNAIESSLAGSGDFVLYGGSDWATSPLPSPGSRTPSRAPLLVRSGLRTLLHDGAPPAGVSPPAGMSPRGRSSGMTSPSNRVVDEAAKILLEGLDTNLYLGSSSYANPFLPRLPRGTNTDVPDILGTSLDGDMAAILPAVSPPSRSPRSGSRTAGAWWRRSSQPDAESGGISPGAESLSQRGSFDSRRTTVLLNNVRVSLSADPSLAELRQGLPEEDEEGEKGLNDRAPSDTGIPGVTSREEEQGLTFHMDPQA